MTLLLPRALALLVVFSLRAEMTPEQRLFDFQHLASMLAKNYGPYEWKREAIGFDLYDVDSWMERVRRAPTDLDYYEIASQYVASLRDTHSQYSLPSAFRVEALVNADIYDGKVLIDFIDRNTLPETAYPFQIGDEILSMDGRPAAQLIQDFARFIGDATPRSRARQAATVLFFRPQRIIPRAFLSGASTVVVVRRASGDLQAFEIPWRVTNVPIGEAGPVPTPRTGRRFTASEGDGIPEWLGFLRRWHERKAARWSRVLGEGRAEPYFQLPDGFQTRLGRTPLDFHYSGVYTAGGRRIGYLRIPTFTPPSAAIAVRELSGEIAYFQANTDGLVVDVTRNPGGGCYGDTALQYLIPYAYALPGDEMRATLQSVFLADLDLLAAREGGAPPWTVALLEEMLRQLRLALGENRGRTGPLPFCGERFEREPLRSPSGELRAYAKPLVVLTDEFTTSWGDIFASVMQDSARGPLVGFRTNGAGGAVSSGPAGFFSEASLTFSISNSVRPRAVQAPGYPPAPYIENIGVHPDIPFDFMTRENLLSEGRLFVEAFTRAILEEIERRRP